MNTKCDQGLWSQIQLWGVDHKMQSTPQNAEWDTLEWTLGCGCSSAWGASDHTRDPPPGACELEKLSRQTFRCAGGTPILIGLSSQIGRLAALPPHPHAMNRMQVGTKCTHEKHGSIFKHRMRWMQKGSQRSHIMRSPHPHKMRGHGRERLGLKACSPRMRAVTGEGRETCTP